MSTAGRRTGVLGWIAVLAVGLSFVAITSGWFTPGHDGSPPESEQAPQEPGEGAEQAPEESPGEESSSPVSPIDTVEACQRMFDDKNDTSWRAADGNVTVALPDGKIVWLFGDTRRERRPFIHNSVLVQEGTRLTSTTGGQAIPNDSDGDFYWPTDGVVDGGLLRVFLGRVAHDGRPGSFVNKGVALATFTFDERGFPMYAGMRNVSSEPEDVGIQWGTAAVSDGGYVYVYGQRRREDPWLFGRDVYLARAPAGELVDLGTWRYWTGSSWVTSQFLARPIEIAETSRFSSNFSVDKVDDTWLVVSKEADAAGNRIIEMAARGPAGPFSVTGTLPAPSSSEQWTYQAKGHPELALGDGRTLVTWNVQSRLRPVDGDFVKPRCGAL